MTCYDSLRQSVDQNKFI